MSVGLTAKAGRAYGGNDGLAFAMCAARGKTEFAGQGGKEAFLLKDFLVTFVATKVTRPPAAMSGTNIN